MAEKQIRNIRVVELLAEVFQELQPVLWKIYRAEYFPAYKSGTRSTCEFCIIEINGKRIVIRPGEYELVGD